MRPIPNTKYDTVTGLQTSSNIYKDESSEQKLKSLREYTAELYSHKKVHDISFRWKSELGLKSPQNKSAFILDPRL